MRAYLWATAVRRGFFGGSRTWMTVLTVMASVRLLKRLAGSVPETRYSEELKPGEALLITHHGDIHLGDEPR